MLKKGFVLFAVVLGLYMSLSAGYSANYYVENESGYTMLNFWDKRSGKYEEKVMIVGSKLLNDNKIDKRIPFIVSRDNVINANSQPWNKVVTIHKGIFPYFDNDDELAAIIAHEISHSLDAYDGVFKWIAVKFNSKSYEYKSDLIAIDLMVGSGYNPIAFITAANKFFPEDHFDFGFWTSHPKTSKRLLAAYKYINVKYPWALKSPMTNNIQYVNFQRVADRDIREFEQKQKAKELKQKGLKNEL